MKNAVSALAFLICLGSTPALKAESVPFPQSRILCLGDSITQASDQELSWRYHLWTRLVDAGWTGRFVGTLTSNHQGDPDWPKHKGLPFDSHHDARWGWTATKVADSLPEWLGSVDADIALVHLGTNDVLLDRDPQQAVGDLHRIVEALRKDNPRIQIFLARILPAPRSVDSFNEALAAAVPSWQQEASPIYLVDMNQGFDLRTQTYDGLHPNSDGEEWMAERWFEALQKHPWPGSFSAG